MTFDSAQAQAKTAGNIFDLTSEEQKWLQVVPYKGSLPTPVPTDPKGDRVNVVLSGKFLPCKPYGSPAFSRDPWED